MSPMPQAAKLRIRRTNRIRTIQEAACERMKVSMARLDALVRSTAPGPPFETRSMAPHPSRAASRPPQDEEWFWATATRVLILRCEQSRASKERTRAAQGEEGPRRLVAQPYSKGAGS